MRDLQRTGEPSKEHAVGRRMRDTLGTRGLVGEYSGTTYVGAREALAIVLHGVCGTCNRRWLEYLDRKAWSVLEPILGPLPARCASSILRTRRPWPRGPSRSPCCSPSASSGTRTTAGSRPAHWTGCTGIIVRACHLLVPEYGWAVTRRRTYPRLFKRPASPMPRTTLSRTVGHSRSAMSCSRSSAASRRTLCSVWITRPGWSPRACTCQRFCRSRLASRRSDGRPRSCSQSMT